MKKIVTYTLILVGISCLVVSCSNTNEVPPLKNQSVNPSYTLDKAPMLTDSEFEEIELRITEYGKESEK